VVDFRIVASNRKAYHNYTILETLEAGLVLSGSEIKSVRESRISLSEAYVKAENGELWLTGAHIARYDPASYMGHEPTRRRRLLLRRKEINRLFGKLQEKGLALVPLKVYIKERLAKLEIGLGRGKKLYDKRETTLRRDVEREMERALKRN